VNLPFISGRAGLAAEQTTSLTGRAVSSGANDQVGDVLGQQFGQVAASTLAGDDPAEVGGAPLTDTEAMAQATGSAGYGPLVLDGTWATLTARASSGDSGQLASSATGASCTDLAGAAMTGRPCSKTVVQQSGAASLELDLKAIGGRDLTAVDLVTAAAPSSGGATAWTGRYTTPGGTTCATVSGAGCVAAGVDRKVGALSAGQLPAGSGGDVVPGSTLVQLTNYADSICAETGAANLSTVPTPTRTATLTYLTSSGTSSLALTKNTSVNATLATRTGSYTTPSGTPLTVSVTGVLTVKPVVPAAAPADPTCKATACVKEVTVPSLLVTLTYTVQHGTTTPVSFDVKVDLGSAFAAATYKAAPSA